MRPVEHSADRIEIPLPGALGSWSSQRPLHYITSREIIERPIAMRVTESIKPLGVELNGHIAQLIVDAVFKERLDRISEQG